MFLVPCTLGTMVLQGRVGSANYLGRGPARGVEAADAECGVLKGSQT